MTESVGRWFDDRANGTVRDELIISLASLRQLVCAGTHHILRLAMSVTTDAFMLGDQVGKVAVKMADDLIVVDWAIWTISSYWWRMDGRWP